MPGGGGDPLVQAVSYQMKYFRPGSFPKVGKADRHRQRISGDPLAELRRRVYYLKYRTLKAHWLLVESAEAFRGDARRKIEAFLAFIERELGKPGSVLPAFLSLKGFSGGVAGGVFSVLNHGPPAAGKDSRILPRLRFHLVHSARRLLCACLAAFMLFFGLAQGKGSASPPPQEEQIEVSGAKPLNLEAPSYSKLYDNLMKAGIELAANPEKRKEAVETFVKAIQLDPGKKLKPLSTLDEKTKDIYMEAIQKTTAPNLEEPAKEKKKSNTALWIVGGAVVAAAAGYLIYKAVTKDNNDDNSANKVTLSFDIIKYRSGVVKTTTKTVDKNSSVTLTISELGLSDVDATHLILRNDSENGRLNTLITYDKSSGKVTFTAPTVNTDYDAFVLPKLANNDYTKIDEWVAQGAGTLYLSPSCTYSRHDEDGATGPEQPITDVVSQFNSSTNDSGILLGKITKVDSNGDIGIGYCSRSLDVYGIHSNGPPPVALVNVNTCKNDIIRRRIFFAEIFEELTQTKDIDNGANTYTLITDDAGNLNDIGKALFAYVYLKDSKTSDALADAMNAMAAAAGMLNLNADLGNGVNIGFLGNGLSAGFKGRGVGLATAIRFINGDLENMTSANFNLGKFDASVGALLSPTQSQYSAEAIARLKQADVGVRARYDARTGANAVGLSVGKNDWGVSYDRDQFGSNLTNAFKLHRRLDIGGNAVFLTGGYSNIRGALNSEMLSLGANAQLDHVWKGLSLNTSFNRFNQAGVRSADLYTIGAAKSFGPVNFNLGVIGGDGKLRTYNVAVSFNKEF